MSDCRSCSGRLFHSADLAVAKQWSPNWLRDLIHQLDTQEWCQHSSK